MKVNCVKTSVDQLEKKLHPNHYLIFHFKQWFLKLIIPGEATQCKMTPQQDGNKHPINVRIDLLELKMRYHFDLMKIEEALDGGVTAHRAMRLKALATCRIQLSQLHLQANLSDPKAKLDHAKQIKFAMAEFKQVSLSFTFPETS